ncbi:MAG: hypothetical protein V1701_02580 [Planctomycetota bacterium]
MAHTIIDEQFDMECPRCGYKEIKISTYHFGATTTAMCSNCSFGESNGCDKNMAMARLRGKYMEYSKEKC